MAKHYENRKYNFLLLFLIICVFIMLVIIAIFPYINLIKQNNTDTTKPILEHTSSNYKIFEDYTVKTYN